ncbi:DUF6153 family protein [Streptomyces sp. NPDC048751]|uniref:DUF6153 family protein n=1 Tax=Streptomyces sp. NPDC048751 TaxID=3365591 RepID=UPI00371E129D
MCRVNGPEQYVPRPPLRRWRAWCVLGLLVGLLSMHGLAPGGAPHAHSSPRVMAAAETAHDGCAGDGHCGGGHAQHADATCASGAVSGGPVVPGLVPDPAPVPVAAETLCSYVLTDQDGARAPPSLSELQLLRI